MENVSPAQLVSESVLILCGSLSWWAVESLQEGLPEANAWLAECRNNHLARASARAGCTLDFLFLADIASLHGHTHHQGVVTLVPVLTY